MITGTASERVKVGDGSNTNGGGQQFELDQEIPSSSFSNERSLDGI
jgi:hypothetical protein